MKKSIVTLMLISMLYTYPKTTITLNNQTDLTITIALDQFRTDRKHLQRTYHLTLPAGTRQPIRVPSSKHTLYGKKHYTYDLAATSDKVGGYQYFAKKVDKDSQWNITKDKTGKLQFNKT